MFKKLLKSLKLVEIDVYIYVMNQYCCFDNPIFNFKIKKDLIKKGIIRYSIRKDDCLVHDSFLYEKVFLMKLIAEKGPVIGNCFTTPEFRGQSIYPTVINYIAKDVLIQNNEKQIFVIVNKSNIPSIKGIEKAGFKRYASIKAKRWLMFYFKKSIKYNKN